MNTRAQKARVGAFIAVTVGVLVAVVVVFAGMRFWEKRERYSVEFKGSVLGLERGAEVLLNGVQVGEVTGIRVSPRDFSRVEVDLEVERGTPVRADTRALLVFRGVTGLKDVDLREGTPASPALPPGSHIEPGLTTLDRLEQEIDRLARSAGDLTEQTSRALDAITRTSEEFAALLAENRAGVRTAVTSMGLAARNMASLVDGDGRTLVARAGALVGSLEEVVRGNRGELSAALTDFRRTTADLEELVREVRERPSRLFYSKPPRDRELP